MDVDDSPVVVESLTICPTIPGAATVVDVYDSYSTACPILYLVSESGWAEAGGPAMAYNKERRSFALGCFVLRVLGRIEEGERGSSVLCGKLDRVWYGEVFFVDGDFS